MKLTPKSAFLGLIGVVALIVVFQNTETVRTQLLFFTITMPLFLLLALALAVGMLFGFLLRRRVNSKKKKTPG